MLGETPATDGARELPATLHGLLAARLDRLDAARPGRRSRTPRSSATPGRSSSCAPSRPAAAPTPIPRSRGSRPQDLLELDDDEYRFRNELTRDVAYGTLTKAERARRHGTLAKLIAEDGRGQRPHRGGPRPARLPLQPRRVAHDRARRRSTACRAA